MGAQRIHAFSHRARRRTRLSKGRGPRRLATDYLPPGPVWRKREIGSAGEILAIMNIDDRGVTGIPCARFLMGRGS